MFLSEFPIVDQYKLIIQINCSIHLANYPIIFKFRFNHAQILYIYIYIFFFDNSTTYIWLGVDQGQQASPLLKPSASRETILRPHPIYSIG